MEEFKLTEEHLAYSPEELDTIEKLRSDREDDKVTKQKDLEWIKRQKDRSFKVGSPIFVTIDGVAFSGYIIKINKVYNWSLPTYDADTVNGVFNNLTYKQIRGRRVTDYSHVVVPEEVKAKSTRSLLRDLQHARLHNNYYYDAATANIFTYENIKAELATREHITNKREKKVVKNFKKK